MACNHFFIKRTNDAKCVHCPKVITLQEYYRWLKEKEKHKRPPPRET